MPLKREPCRNFQRGSCRYGDKCKFLHVTQQPKSNPFGFGSQNPTPFQQQKPNPFGFGVQNSGPTGATKPFENKWVRGEQPSNQSQAASHKCTDPESCKRLIAEDFQNERPLWKLTCYGHNKYLPCDITGDISYEELRALAYDEAKRGTSLQSIVERERSLVNSKLIEFQNLLQNFQAKNNPIAPTNQNSFPTVGISSFPMQNNGPPPFNQTPPNMSFGVRPSTPTNTGFGQLQGNPGPFVNNSISSGPFGSQVPPQTGGNVMVPNSLSFGTNNMNNQVTQIPTQTSGNTFMSSGAPFGNFGASNQGSQVPVQTSGVSFASNLGGFGNTGLTNQGSQIPVTSSLSLPTQTPVVDNLSLLSNDGASNGSQKTVDQNVQEASAIDASIWLKDKWETGEIPEQFPPDTYVR